MLWLLRPRGPYAEPWGPTDDSAVGMVVRADTDEEARAVAMKNGGAETSRNPAAWIDADLSTCEPILEDGDPAVILADYGLD